MKTLHHKFVEYIPEQIEEGIIYLSMEYCTAIHKCVCGCGEEVVTPFSPNDWKLTFDGKSVSLYPSIGNWSFECQSHYWIKSSRIEHAGRWSQKEIDTGRDNDIKRKMASIEYPQAIPEAVSVESKHRLTLWGKIRRFLRL